MSNEFEELDVEETFSGDTSVPNNAEEDMITSSPMGKKYDWKTAPKNTKQAPRKNLDGLTVTIVEADIVLPDKSVAWLKTKKGDKEFKGCQFILKYDKDSQSEYYSGCRVFNRDGKYSHPTITRDGVNQASALLKKYADFKKKDINEVSLHEFLAYLNSKPKAVLKYTEFRNPETGQLVNKNMVERFV